MQLDISNTPEVVNKVLNYEVDIGMIEGKVKRRDLDLIPWLEDELMVFCAASHPLAEKGKLSARDMREAHWILREPDSGARQTFERALGPELSDLNIHLEFRHNEAIKNAVESGLGIGCLSRIVLERNFANGDLVPLALPRRDLMRNFYFVLPRQRYPLESVSYWMDTCRSVDT